MIEPKVAEARLTEKEARLAEIRKKIEACEDRTKQTVAESVVFLEDALAEGRRRLEKAKGSGADRWDHLTEWFDEQWDDVTERAESVWKRLTR